MASRKHKSGNASFKGSGYQLDFLTQPSGLMDFGLDPNKVKMGDKAKDSDKVFVVAYPYFNVQGALAALFQALTHSAHPGS